MRKKAMFSDLLGFFVIVSMLMITVYMMQVWWGYGKDEVQGVYSNYLVTYADRDIATFVSVFEKTALFSGLAGTITDIGKSGGVPASMASLQIQDATGESPRFSGPAYLWNYVGDDNENKKRIPFVIYQDTNAVIGTEEYAVSIPNPNDDDAPPRAVFVRAWMYGKGSIDISFDAQPLGTINKTGLYFYEIPGEGTIAFNGSAEGIGEIKTVAASPYAGTDDFFVFVNSINSHLTGKIGSAQADLKKSKILDAPAIVAVFSNSGNEDGFATGFAMPEGGIDAKISGADLPEIEAWSFGAAETTLKARYWKLYDIARDEIVLNDALYGRVEENFKETIEKTTDNIYYWIDGCGSCSASTCEGLLWGYGKTEEGNALGTSPDTYLGNKMDSILQQEVEELKSSLNEKYSGDGIVIEMSYSISEIDGWDGYWKADEYNRIEEDTGICCGCSEYSCSSCGKYAVCSRNHNKCSTECRYRYGAVYTLTTTIKDTKYRITAGEPKDVSLTVVSQWISTDDLQENVMYADKRKSANKCSTPKPTDGCYEQTGLVDLIKSSDLSFSTIDDCGGFGIGSYVEYQEKECYSGCYSKYDCSRKKTEIDCIDVEGEEVCEEKEITVYSCSYCDAPPTQSWVPCS